MPCDCVEERLLPFGIKQAHLANMPSKLTALDKVSQTKLADNVRMTIK